MEGQKCPFDFEKAIYLFIYWSCSGSPRQQGNFRTIQLGRAEHNWISQEPVGWQLYHAFVALGASNRWTAFSWTQFTILTWRIQEELSSGRTGWKRARVLVISLHTLNSPLIGRHERMKEAYKIRHCVEEVGRGRERIVFFLPLPKY